MVQQIILSCEIFGTTNHDIEVSKILNDELLLQLTFNLLCSSNFRFVLESHLTCPPPPFPSSRGPSRSAESSVSSSRSPINLEQILNEKPSKNRSPLCGNRTGPLQGPRKASADDTY